mmetsp:Transcript_9175/g.17956  ORF Transcript_9175/g.17956 Transcript_9175/m.17956 type:complete len:244 (+) Transcript_9175:750-1481(+)
MRSISRMLARTSDLTTLLCSLREAEFLLMMSINGCSDKGAAAVFEPPDLPIWPNDDDRLEMTFNCSAAFRSFLSTTSVNFPILEFTDSPRYFSSDFTTVGRASSLARIPCFCCMRSILESSVAAAHFTSSTNFRTSPISFAILSSMVFCSAPTFTPIALSRVEKAVLFLASMLFSRFPMQLSTWASIFESVFISSAPCSERLLARVALPRATLAALERAGVPILSSATDPAADSLSDAIESAP